MTTYDDRPWTNHYDSHVPASLEPYPEHNMQEFLKQTVKKNGSGVALITTAKLPVIGRLSSVVTYNQLDQLSDAFAAGLVDMGLEKGDRVVIVMPNCVAFAIAYFAILKAGGVVAATNPTYPPKKMQFQINDSDAKFVIVLSLFYKLIKAIQPETKVQTVIATNIKEYMPAPAKILFTVAREKKDGHRIEQLESGDHWFQDVLTKYKGRRPDIEVTVDDIALFQYTGGTTGASKGAIADHRALVCNTYQLQRWSGMSMDMFAIPTSEMILLGALPMFHAYGLVALLTQTTAAGGKIVLIPNPRDIDELVDCIDHYKPNVFLGVPALYNAINNHPRIVSGEVSLKSFLFNSSGSAPLPGATKREFEDRSESIISEGFGMSETPVATHSNPMNGVNKINSIGMPLPDVEARIVSLDDGTTVLPIGEVGELIIHAKNLMRGYHKLPTETANTLRQLDGKTWIYTGDIARMDDEGYFFLVDRKKDMALIGGFNVYPTAVENALKEHPAVLEVGVAAIPHPEKEGQEALKAWIVLRPHQTVTEQELIQHCEQYLAGYEIPRRFGFIDELPKTIVGKTLRRELIQMEMDEMG